MKSVVLIGMPGSGKSTVGVLLAKELRRQFVDTDLLIQSATGRALQEIIDVDGVQSFLEVEERAILDFAPRGEVIATGGSAVYSESAMRHLSRDGVVVFLDVPCDRLMQRLNNLEIRGIARRPGQAIEELWRERDPLYRHWAHVTVQNVHEHHEQIVDEILAHPVVAALR